MPRLEIHSASAALAAHKARTAANLTAARDLIATAETWTQGCYARGRQGQACNVFARSATCFCAIGALCKITARLVEQTGEAQPEMAALHDAIGMSVSSYNDMHSHAHVLSMFDRAIEALTAGSPDAAARVATQ